MLTLNQNHFPEAQMSQEEIKNVSVVFSGLFE